MSLLLHILECRQVNFTRLRVFLHEAKANIEENTLFGVNWNAYDNSEIHIFLGDHVSHFAGTFIHETAHSLVNTLENEGHTDEWIRVTVRLMMLINIFLTETKHLLCGAIKGEIVCTVEEISDAVVIVK